jgi:hypothetical protein
MNLKFKKNFKLKMKQTIITNYFKKIIKKIYGYDSENNNWHCIECGTNMGPNNPRQLCGKFICIKYY